jgi:hypothetical protein
LILSLVNIFLLILLIVTLLPFAFAAGPRETVTQPGLATLPVGTSLPADTATITPISSPTQAPLIETQTPGSTPEQDNEKKMIWLIAAEALGLSLLVFFIGFASKLSRNQARIYDVDVSKVNVQDIGRALLPAGFVAFLLLLLPSLVTGILMPLLVPFLLFGFFDVIRVYPNQYLKTLVATYYSKIIFIAEFGAWYSFLSVLKNYSGPFFAIYMSAWQAIIRNQEWGTTINRWPQLIWDYAPFVLAILLAIRPWRRIRDLSRQGKIAEIKASMDS